MIVFTGAPLFSFISLVTNFCYCLKVGLCSTKLFLFSSSKLGDIRFERVPLLSKAALEWRLGEFGFGSLKLEAKPVESKVFV